MLDPSSFLAFLLAAVPALPPELPLERIFDDPPLTGRPPQQVQLAPDGSRILYLRASDADSEVLDLWGATLPGDGRATRLVSAADLLGGATQKLSEAERMALERKRISERGITEYAFCGKGGDALLFPFSGDLYLGRLTPPGQPPGVTVTRLTRSEDAPEMAPRCNRDGTAVGYVRGGDLYLLTFAGQGAGATPKERRLTREAGETRTFGLAEFIAEEEMDRHEAFWFSPDGKRMLVFEVDESPVGVKMRPQIFADHTEMFAQRYPAAGEANARVTPWLFDTASGRRTRVAAPAVDGYLPRGGFFADGTPWIQWQSRDQRRLELLEIARDGKTRRVLEDTDERWIELHSDLYDLGPKAERLVWTSERTGRRQIEIVDRATGARRTLDHGPEPIVAVAGVSEDAKTVFATAWRDRGRRQHVLAVPVDGGPARDLSPEATVGVVEIALDTHGHHFVRRASRFGHPWLTTVHEASTGRALMTLEPPDIRTLEAARGDLALEWVEVRAEDGTPLNAFVLPPRGLAPGAKAPVIVHIYGGPGGQNALDGWSREFLHFLRYTRRGYGVFVIDNRGTAGRGRAFSRAFHHAFGDVDVRDLFAGVAQLKTLPWVDPQAIGIYGWSYGGTLAGRALLDPATPFACGIAIAPVTDWRLYDTHYTERFLGLPGPAEAPAAPYVQSDLVRRAGALERPFLLMHGTADDNVLFENSLRLVDALQAKGKLFDLSIYPGKAHGISGRVSRLHLYRTLEAFFDRHLRRSRP